MDELRNGLNGLRRNLKKSAECVEAFHNASHLLRDEDIEEIREACLNNVNELEALDTEALKVIRMYDEIAAEYKEKETEFPDSNAAIDKLIAKFAKKQKKIEHGEDIYQQVRNSIKESAEEANDSQMQVMQVQHSGKDPISKKTIVNPVKYPPCGHVYDRESIEQFVGKKRTVKCAYQGCSEVIDLSKLVDYPEFWDDVKEPI